MANASRPILEPEADPDLWRRFHDNLGIICILLMIYLLFNTISLVLMGFRDWELSHVAVKSSPVRLLNLSMRWLALTDLFTTTIAFTYFWSDKRWAETLYWTMEDLCLYLQFSNDGFIVVMALLTLTLSPVELASLAVIHRTPLPNNNAPAAPNSPSTDSFSSAINPTKQPQLEEEERGQWRLWALRCVWVAALSLSVPNASVAGSPVPGSIGRTLAFWRDIFIPLTAYSLVLFASAAIIAMHVLESTVVDLYLAILLLTYLITRFPAHSIRLILWNITPPLYSNNASFRHLFTETSVLLFFVKIFIHFILNMGYSELVSCCNLRQTVAGLRRCLRSSVPPTLPPPLPLNNSTHILPTASQP